MASDPQNNSLIIHSIIPDDGESSSYNNLPHLISLVTAGNGASETDIISLVNPFPIKFDKMYVLGSINGIVCLACPIRDHMIVLWNPAINQWKPVRRSKNKLGNGDPNKLASLGFCFDSENNDLKVVRVVCSIVGLPSVLTAAEIYSSTEDSWKLIEIDFLFNICSHQYFIVKGDPIWFGIVNRDPYDAEFFKRKCVYIKFDVRAERFEQLPYHAPEGILTSCLVEWKDSLAWIGASPDIVELWMYDEAVSSWSKKFTVGIIGMNVRKLLHYWNSGDILASKPNGEVFLFDHKGNSIREIPIQGDRQRVFPYTESLICLKQMKPVKRRIYMIR